MSTEVADATKTQEVTQNLAQPFWKNDRLFGLFLGVISGMLWGLDTVLLNESYWEAPLNGDWESIITGAVATMVHDLISAGILLVILVVFRLFTEVKEAFSSYGIFWMMLASIFGAPIGMLGYLMAIDYIGAAYTAAISALYPALGAFLAFLILKDRLRLLGWIGLALAVVGTICTSITAVVEGGTNVRQPGYGILFALMCTIGWGVECVIADYSFRHYSMNSTVALSLRQMTSVVIYSVVIINIIGDDAYTVTREIFKEKSIDWIAGASVSGTFSYLAYYAAIDKLGATQAMGLNITYAIWTIIFGTAFKVYPAYAGVIVVCILAICIGSFLCSGLGKEPCPWILMKSWFGLASEAELKQMEQEKMISATPAVSDVAPQKQELASI